MACVTVAGAGERLPQIYGWNGNSQDRAHLQDEQEKWPPWLGSHYMNTEISPIIIPGRKIRRGVAKLVSAQALTLKTARGRIKDFKVRCGVAEAPACAVSEVAW